MKKLKVLERNFTDRASMRLVKFPFSLRSKYQKLKWLRSLLFYTYLTITIFQKPIWCNHEFDNECQKDYKIPTMVNYYLPINIYYCLEICILLLLSFSKVNQQDIKVISSKMTGNLQRKRTLFILIVTGFIIIINDIIVMIYENDFKYNISLLLKPLIILCFRQLNNINRHSFCTIFLHYCQIINKSKKIYFLMLFSLTFFTGLGVALFSDVDTSLTHNDEQCEMYSPPFQQPLKCIIILLFVLTTTVNSPDIYLPYYLQYRPQIIYFISFQFINTLLIINFIIATFYSSFKRFMDEKTHIYINNHNRSISRYAQAYLKEKALSEINEFGDDNFEFTKPNVFKIMENKLYQISVQLICLCTFVSIFIKGSTLKFGILFIINTLFMIEIITVWRFSKKIKQSKLQIIDMLLNTLIFILNCINLAGHNQENLLSITLCYRLFRGCKWLLSFPEQKYLIFSLLQISNYFIQLFGPLFILFMLFTGLGQLLFGGLINETNSTPEHYELANFNDFLSGMCTCWFLLLVNNWNVLAYNFAQVLQSDAVYIFFIGFYIIVVLFFLNVTIAQLIDYLVTKINSRQQCDEQ